eukprot:2518861-Karenia_brevis.AAC.1
MTEKVKRAEYITQPTFQLILEKRALIKTFTWCGRAMKYSSMRAAFNFWARRPWRCVWHSVRGFASKKLCMQRVWSGVAAKALAPQIKSMISLERLANLEARSSQVDAAIMSSNPQ